MKYKGLSALRQLIKRYYKVCSAFKLKKVTVNMDDDKEAEVESQVLNLIENPVYCKTCPNR